MFGNLIGGLMGGISDFFQGSSGSGSSFGGSSGFLGSSNTQSTSGSLDTIQSGADAVIDGSADILKGVSGLAFGLADTFLNLFQGIIPDGGNTPIIPLPAPPIEPPLDNVPPSNNVTDQDYLDDTIYGDVLDDIVYGDPFDDMTGDNYLDDLITPY